MSKGLFSKRETPGENIAFLSLVAALNAVIALLVSFVPFSAVFAVIFLPSISAYAAFLAKGKYLPVYVVGASLLSMAFSSYDIGAGLFYVVPSIFSGTLLGFFLRYKDAYPSAVFLASILNLGMTYLSLPIIQLLTGVDFIDFALSVFSLSGNETALTVVPTFLFVYSLASAFLSSIFVYVMREKMGLGKRGENRGFLYFEAGFAAIFAILGMILEPFAIGVAILFFSFSVALSLLRIPTLFTTMKWYVYVSFVVLEIACFFVNVAIVGGLSFIESVPFAGIFVFPYLLLLLATRLPKAKYESNGSPRFIDEELDNE